MQASQVSSVCPAGKLAGPGAPAAFADLPAAASQGAAKSPASVSLVTISQPAAKATPVSGHMSVASGAPRVAVPQQAAPAKAAHTTTIQLPANFQIPPGTVLIRSGNGQLMLVSQQALARAQAQVQNAGSRPLPSSTPAIQLRTIQNPRATLQSNLANASVKSVPLPPLLTTVPLTPTFQRGPSALQSTATSGNIVKVSPSLVGRQSAIPAMPTIVKISKPSTPHSGLTNHGTSTIIIRTRVPDATAVPACLPAAAPTSTVSPVAVQTSSGTSPMRTLIPLPTPVTTSACSAAVIPVKTVISSSSAALPTPISVKIVNSAGTPTNGATTPSPVTQTASNNDSVVKLPMTVGTPVTSVVGNGSQVLSSAPVQTTLCITPAVCVDKVPATVTAQVPTTSPNLVISKVEPAKVTPTAQTTNSTETMDNVKKCKNFLATLIKLASSGPQSPTMGQNVKNLVKNLLDSKLEPEEFTGKLYKELKSSPQPYLVPFLKKSLPALRRLMPNSQEFISQCGQPNPPSISVSNTPGFVKIIATSTMPSVKQIGTTLCGVKANQVPSAPVQPINNMKTVNIKQLVVQQPSSGILKHVTTIPPTSMCAIQKPGEKRITLNALIQAGQMQPATVKQVLLPENKVISLQATRIPIKESGAACFRDEDDINDVTSMAGVNLNEENACILASNSQYVGAVIRSCHEEPFLFTSALQNRILEIGKRHDIKELNSNVMNLVSHATQERLRGLIEKLTVAAQHRSMNYKQSDRYHQSSDVRAQLKYFEQLEQLEKQRRNEEEREMLLRAARSRSNKEDPEHLRLKQKAKEMQQLELEQLQYREANLAALAAIGPRRKRPLDSIHLQNGLEDANGVFGLSRPALLQKRTRVCLRDLIFCMEQDRATRYSLSIYRALLK